MNNSFICKDNNKLLTYSNGDKYVGELTVNEEDVLKHGKVLFLFNFLLIIFKRENFIVIMEKFLLEIGNMIKYNIIFIKKILLIDTRDMVMVFKLFKIKINIMDFGKMIW